MKSLVLAAAVVGLAGCLPNDKDTFTLYRGSPLGGNMRIHMATFDSKDGPDYNSENCAITAELFQRQPGVSVRYWCEKGRYSK